MRSFPLTQLTLTCALILLSACGDPEKSLSITAATPSSGATSVDPSTTFSVQFSEDMDPATVSSSTVKLTGAQGEIPATVVVNGREIRLTPNALLGLAGPYQLLLGAELRSTKGKGLPGKTTISVTTRAGQWEAVSTSMTGTGAVNRLVTAAGKDGSAVVANLFKSGNNTVGLRVSRFDPANRQWISSELDPGSSGQAANVVVKVLDNGDAWVSWNSSTNLLTGGGSQAAYSRFSKAQGSWSAPAAVGQGVNTFDADLTPLPKGGATLVWHYQGASLADIYTRTMDSAGTLSNPIKLGTGAARSSCATQQADAQGNITAIWHAADNAGQAVMVSRFDSSTQQWKAAESLYRTSGGIDCHVQLKADGAGNLVAAWIQRASTSGTGNEDFALYTSRFRLSDARWDTPRQLDSVNALRTSAPQISIDPAGQAVLSWMVTLSDNLLGVTYSIKAANYPLASAPGQTLLVGNGTAQQLTQPVTLRDATGNPTLAWSVDGKLLSRQYSNGVWQSIETPASNLTRDSNQLAIAADDAGGLATWLVSDNLSNMSVFTMRLNTDGRWESPIQLATGSDTTGTTLITTAMTNGRALAAWNRGTAIASRVYR
ncbi:hypothetical protein HNQ59_000968 [Chitinivorax tropicus]|uniref:SbsA Ig-like domain-containing protein n=1 Tax=Chitinivorax tropicus TaxID=714531 RepID=A0A840MKN5_9PROT|nr:Ig-like domain-containing protein [Chitinivorax tropicus]MBB5017699.1 hypothetical protein [Chitinivorax tropicus]